MLRRVDRPLATLAESSRTSAVSPSALELSHLSKTFAGKGETVTALDDVSLSVRDGEFVTLLGPSGCGKSTIFNIVAGLAQPTKGRVLMRGEDVTGETGHVGYMFQRDVLLPWRTVMKNLLVGPQVLGQPPREARAEALAILERLGLAKFADRYPAQLSGGMRQRAAFGRTLLFHKDVLLLDEPLGALDSMTREQMQEWLLEVWQEFKKTVLLVSHDIAEAVFLSDRIYVMSPSPGRIRAEVEVDLPRPRHENTRLSPEFGKLEKDVYRLVRGLHE
jgi:ABC-type nitrate/sulfonate/bicarbonate transport system ATPase subunit